MKQAKKREIQKIVVKLTEKRNILESIYTDECKRYEKFPDPKSDRAICAEGELKVLDEALDSLASTITDLQSITGKR